VLLVNSLQNGKTSQARAQQTEKSLPHKLCSYTSSLCTCPACRLVWSKIRNSLYAEKAEKLIKINWFYRAEEDNR